MENRLATQENYSKHNIEVKENCYGEDRMRDFIETGLPQTVNVRLHELKLNAPEVTFSFDQQFIQELTYKWRFS